MENIRWVLHVAYSESGRDAILRSLLEHRTTITDIQRVYRDRYHISLLDDVKAQLPRGDSLRAYDYMTFGRLRAVSKILLAFDGLGTSTEALWRVLPEAFREGAPNTAWTELVGAGLPITQRWSGMTLDAALTSELSTYELTSGDLDRARALLRFGVLRPIDKIRIATNRVGTDTTMLFEALGAADSASVARAYEAEYHENLEHVLFDQFDAEGNLTSSGELSGEDAARARALLSHGISDPNRLVELVRVAVTGAGTNNQLIWDSVDDAVRRGGLEANPGDPAPGTPAQAPWRAQVRALRAQVEDPRDPLGLGGWFGDLNAGELSRLQAMLGIRQTSTGVPGGGSGLNVLDDLLVTRVRALGGTDNGSTFDAMLRARPADLAAFRPAYAEAGSPLRTYLWDNVTINSGDRGRLTTVINGTIYARLQMCRGGDLRDDYEQYAYDLIEHHASPDERAELRRALRELQRPAASPPDSPAVRAMRALMDAFNDSEMSQVRTRLRVTGVAALDEAEELEQDVERERSWWLGLNEDLADERRELRADVNLANAGGAGAAGASARLEGDVTRTREALEGYIRVRDEITGYVSTVVGFASGLLVTAVTGGAAGPALAAALLRAAAASAVARVVTEKTLRGDRFDVVGGDGARAFALGAVDGVMSVVSSGAASSLLEHLGQQGVRDAIALGTASTGLRLAHTAVDGAISGGVSGAVDSITTETTWTNGVKDGLVGVFNAAITSAGQGAALNVGMDAGRSALGLHPNPTAFHDAHPVVRAAIERGESRTAACRHVLETFGRWETAIAHLRAGTGAAQAMSAGLREELIGALVAHRAEIVAHLGSAEFNARPVGAASSEPGSDMDLNVNGPRAGEQLLAARQYLDTHHPNWQERYRMALLLDASRVSTVNEHLSHLTPDQQNTVRARTSSYAEQLTLARELRSAAPEERAAMLGRIGDGETRAAVESLSNMDEAARRAAHDAAVMRGDQLLAQLASATTPVERLRLAEAVTRTQMLANAMGEDAYISPGGVRGFALGGRLSSPHEFHQAAMDQIGMITHQIHGAEGVLEAMRRYEMFKYVMRYCEIVEQAGLGDAEATFFKHWAELVYRVDRGATSTDGARTVTPGDLASSSSRSSVRYDDLGFATGPSDAFLLDNYGRFRDFARSKSNAMRERAMAGTGEVPSVPLIELPPAPALPPRATGDTGTGGAPGTAVGGAHAPDTPPGAAGGPDGSTVARPATTTTTATPAGTAVDAALATGLRSDEALGRVARAVASSEVSRAPTPVNAARIVVNEVADQMVGGGVPRPTIEIGTITREGVLGLYFDSTNTIRIDPAKFGDIRTNPVALQRFVESIVHECRHAEQTFQAMRYEASRRLAEVGATTTSPVAVVMRESMHREFGVDPRIIRAATESPLTPGSPEYEFGRRTFDAGYGSGRAATQTTYRALERYHHLIAQRDMLRAEMATVASASPRFLSLYQQLVRVNEELSTHVNTEANYRALHSEADAYATGAAARAATFRQQELATLRADVATAEAAYERVKNTIPADEQRALELVIAAQNRLVSLMAQTPGELE